MRKFNKQQCDRLGLCFRDPDAVDMSRAARDERYRDLREYYKQQDELREQRKQQCVDALIAYMDKLCNKNSDRE